MTTACFLFMFMGYVCMSGVPGLAQTACTAANRSPWCGSLPFPHRVFGGFSAGRLYRTLKGHRWKKGAFCVSVLNLLPVFLGSQEASSWAPQEQRRQALVGG